MALEMIRFRVPIPLPLFFALSSTVGVFTRHGVTGWAEARKLSKAHTSASCEFRLTIGPVSRK
jgi:hypothetical protein